MKRIALSLVTCLLFLSSFGQLNVTELGQLTYNTSLSDIWGHVDKLGNEYALVGVYNGFSIVDVTNPDSANEVYFEQGVNSIWRDIKTWDNHAYVSTEGGDGILIVDMNPLPGDITSSTSFTGSTYPFTTVHNIYIDELGKLYIFGANSGSGGAIICDLTADPMNPVELGRFDAHYLHDGMARGDTLWGGAIYEGMLIAIDVSDPANPVMMGTANTPSNFTHNAWVSDDGTHVFTTDEVNGGFIGAFNVTDLDNIFETDRIQSNPGEMVIPHNVHVRNDYLVTSYYTDGVTIHDASRPGNLIEVGAYDTSPNFSGSGYNGCWGAYPFLPSGNILASDMQEGLYILQPDYKRACYLEGTVTDSITGVPIQNAVVTIPELDLSTSTKIDGTYAFGTPISGTYDIEVSHPAYPSDLFTGVELTNGVLTQLDVALSSWYTNVDEFVAEKKIKTYPNPFSSTFAVEYEFSNMLSTDAAVLIYDLNGRFIEEVTLNSSKGSVVLGQDYPQGNYFVKISNGSEQLKMKMVTKR